MASVRNLIEEDLFRDFQKIDWEPSGKVSNVIGKMIEAVMPESSVGTVVEIRIDFSGDIVLGEIVGFRDGRVLIMPFDDIVGINVGARVRARKIFDRVPVGPSLLGKVIDPFGRCMLGTSAEELDDFDQVEIDRKAPNPMLRKRIKEPLCLGIRALDGLLTFCDGQRTAIMAGSGVGKSVLLGMIARGSSADVNVIGLIGERGREVREFIERDLGEEGLARSVVVSVTSDMSPLMRLRAARVTTAVAEYFSSRGQKVLLMMDSLTRVAQAQREIGLAVGEPPTTKGYPPSVFSLLPRLLERAGPQEGDSGSISGLYTVLVDGDDFNDPIPDTVRSIVDGHINLSRELANQGHFPAIDIPTSISRVMLDVADKSHLNLARNIKTLISVYYENIDILQMGTYQPGTDHQLDMAIQLMPQINKFLRQDVDDKASFADSIGGMAAILSKIQGS